MRHTPEGHIYFANSVSKVTTWSDPRYKILLPESSLNISDSVATAPSNSPTTQSTSVQQSAYLPPQGSLQSEVNVDPVASGMAAITIRDEEAESESESEPEGESTAPLFGYHPLESPTHIRVLDIHPAAEFDQPIACTIRHVNLDYRPVYEAPSYTWGEKEN
ncbi:hypothetical protein NW759_015230 [Fusarium solani]|nr:hypothetical protein NW759_015230 [Fusarium solani]